MPKFIHHPDFNPLNSTLIASRRNTEPAVFLYKNPLGEFFLYEVVGMSSSVEFIPKNDAVLRYPSFPEHSVSFDAAFPDVNSIDYLEWMQQVLQSIKRTRSGADNVGVGELLALVDLQTELLELLVKDAKQRRR
jgi:hypothetical protein